MKCTSNLSHHVPSVGVSVQSHSRFALLRLLYCFVLLFHAMAPKRIQTSKRPAADAVEETPVTKRPAAADPVAADPGAPTPRSHSTVASGLGAIETPRVALASGQGGDANPQDLTYVGFLCKFSDASAMLRVSTALQARRLERKARAVDWDSLLTSSMSFALRWTKPVKYHAGYMWFRRLLNDMEFYYDVEGVLSWPPPMAAANQGNASGASGAGAAASSQGVGRTIPCQQGSTAGPSRSVVPLPSWPRHKALKLMISTRSHKVTGPVTAEEWYHLLGEELGRGSFGVVHKASRQGELYAVKVMDPQNRLDAYQELGNVRSQTLILEKKGRVRVQGWEEYVR